jgi:glycerol-1-phosphate dehydrogenase [NAD(P)+]
MVLVMTMKQIELQSYLNKTIQCSCGKDHKTDLKEIQISENALEKIPEFIIKYKYKQIYVVSDQNTYKVAGEKTNEILKKVGITTCNFVFQDETIASDEIAIAKIITAMEPGCDLIIGVGAGTINDLCKFISYKLGIDYFIVATAPSMDGFASNVSAMITNRLKTTYESHVPKVIIGDLTILKEAPSDMIAAGVGDILGKYVCLLDWKIAHMITGEYHCSYIENLIQNAVEVVMSNADKIQQKDIKAIKGIMEGLVLSGIAMSFAGNSRPASGSEHHLSHFWEMMFMFQGREPVLHGIKVGIGTVVAVKLYEYLKDIHIDFEKAKEEAQKFQIEQWEEKICDVYQVAAQEIIEFENKTKKNAPENVLPQIDKLKDNWEEITSLIENMLLPAEKLVALLQQIGASYKPEQEGIDKEMERNSILYAKEIRNRFGLLQIIFDLNIDIT